jgi:hypothetical protein
LFAEPDAPQRRNVKEVKNESLSRCRYPSAPAVDSCTTKAPKEQCSVAQKKAHLPASQSQLKRTAA